MTHEALKMAEDELAWFVIHAQTRKESEVETALRRQGLEIFLPMVAVPSRRCDRKITLQGLFSRLSFYQLHA